MLYAIKAKMEELYPHLHVYLVDGQEFVKKSQLSEWEALRESIDVLLLDDVEEALQDEKSSVDLLHLVHYLYNKEKQMILTSQYAAKELDADERLMSRFQWGLEQSMERLQFSLLTKKEERTKEERRMFRPKKL